MLTLTNRIDMRPGAVPLVIHLGQYDSDFSLVFDLYSSAGNFTVESGTTAMIRGTKTDGNAYDADATINISAKTVTVAGSEQMTAAKGRNVYELVLKKGTKVLSTANFILDVERAAMDADTIASESVLKELNAIIAGAETATEAATDAASAADRAEDAADSVSNASTQIATNTADIADLKADLSGNVGDLKNDIANLGKGYSAIYFGIRKGYYIGTSGIYVENNNNIASDHFPVTQNETLYFVNPHVTYNNAWYDANDNYISKFRIDPGTPTQVIVPANAFYCAISNTVAYWFTDVYRNGLNVIIEDQNTENLLSVSAQTGGNFFDALSCVVGNINDDGDPVSSTTRVITAMFKNQSKGLYIIPERGWMFGILTYGNNTRSWGGWNKKMTELPVNDGIRLVFDTDPASGQTANVEEFSKHFSLSTFSVQQINMANQGDYLSICHQGYSETSAIGNNLLNGYKLAKQHGFNWSETDIKMTSDGVLVCSHDNTFIDSTTSESVTISEHTYAELQQYNYYGSKIASFDDVVKSCKLNGLGLVVDQVYNSTLIDKVYESVHRYAMSKRIAFLFGIGQGKTASVKALCQAAQTHDANVYLMITPTSTDADSEAVALCNELKTSTNNVDLSLNYYTHNTDLVQSLQSQLKDDVNVVVYTVDNSTTYYNYLPYVKGITSNKIPMVVYA